MLPKLRKSGYQTERVPMTIVKNKNTFRTQRDENYNSVGPNIANHGPNYQFFNSRKLSKIKLRNRKSKKKTNKNDYMLNLQEYLENLKNRRFKNININDVNALRTSLRPPAEEITDYSDSDDLENSDEDSKHDSETQKPIQIGNQQDIGLSKAKIIFARQKTHRANSIIEPYDNFLKN